jgi:hypothetical protein
MYVEPRWNDIDRGKQKNSEGKTEEFGEKPVPVPLRPPQIPHGMARTQTRDRAVKGR